MPNMSVWPTDGADGSVANEARWRKMGRYWEPTGVVAGQGGELAPSLSMPNLTVQSGAAWVDGHYCELASNTVITATANGIAVVRFDPAANSADLVWRDAVSVPAQSPTGTYEMLVASTSGSVLTDRRTIPGKWRAYTPAWVTTGSGQPNPGASGVITGRYMVQGKICTLAMMVSFAGAGLSSGNGYHTFTLPVPAVNPMNNNFLPAGNAQLYAPNLGTVFLGHTKLWDLTKIAAAFPIDNTTNTTNWWQTVDNTNAPGTGCPNIAPNYNIQAGGWALLGAVYEIA